MWWKAVKIAAIVSAVLATVAFLTFLIAVTRPALLWGVDGESLRRSVGHGTCEELADGGWDCHVSADPPTHYRVDVDWMGCWKATLTEPEPSDLIPAERDGCIELGDVITFD